MLDDQVGSGNPDPATWAGWHDLTYPVVADGVWAYAGAYAPTGGEFGIPCYTVLDRELRAQAHASSGVLNQGLVEDLLAEPIPEVTWPMP